MVAGGSGEGGGAGGIEGGGMREWANSDGKSFKILGIHLNILRNNQIYCI